MNIAALVCYKPGERSRLIYRLHVYRGRKGEPKTFGWMDYRDLILHAHAQLGAPIVLVWDNLNLHLGRVSGCDQFVGFACPSWLDPVDRRV
ncbi:hypothetical protein OHB01_22080 [Microbispora hainanensis]|uniref:hypothetical protein n=1 Tax=Microbispora hainanensis TaxID=568844 RepID=UPI002E2C5686|nr:hypothetical protein [Microbispora hainanensis]